MPEISITCAMCEQAKPESAFRSYAYTTRQGRRSRRRDGRCILCLAAREAERRTANPGMSSRQAKAARAARPDETRKRNAAYRATDAGRIARASAQRIRNARLRTGEADDEAIRAIYQEASRIERIIALCPVFDLPELGKKMHVDHRTALAKGGKHVASNLQILPTGINLRKGVSCPRSAKAVTS